MKYWTRSFLYRLGGNAGLTFIAPFSGANILEVEITKSILLSVIATVIVTSAIIFRRMEKVGRANGTPNSS